MTDNVSQRIQNVRFSIGSNGRYYFYATDTLRHRTIFLSFSEAVTYSHPISTGLEFSPGYILPYGDIEYKVTSYLIWTNIVWYRRHYKRLPVREPISGELIGWTISFRELPDGEVFIRDIRMPLGTPLNMQELISKTQAVIAKTLTGDSKAGLSIFINENANRASRGVKLESPPEHENITVEILYTTWFIDRKVHQYKKFIDQIAGSPLPG